MAPVAASPDKTNSEKFIQSLKLKKSTCTKHVQKEDCPICLNDFDDNEEVCFLDCTHMFHQNCIVEWVRKKNTCPLCRCKLYEKRDDSTLHVGTNPPSRNVGRQSATPSGGFITYEEFRRLVGLID